MPQNRASARQEHGCRDHLLRSGVLACYCAAVFTGCAATTTFTLTPSPQSPICQRGSQRASAMVLWATNWRVDQKDVLDREAAASAGIGQFFKESGCFHAVEVKRVTTAEEAAKQAAANVETATSATVLTIVVRELGPILKLGSSAALFEGGTDVLLDLSVFDRASPGNPRRFTAHWSNGGEGVIKGVASLPADMNSALQASLQPERR